MQSTALVLVKHLAAAKTLAKAPEPRIGAAEKALGLHGSAKGAGFIMSYIRYHHGTSGPGGFGEDNPNDPPNLKAEWCQHDIVSGRPLPPWAPLRRCVVSGLLSVKITQQKSDDLQVNMTSLWISKWACESPFGGRWARAPSLDLDQHELLQPVHQVNADAAHGFPVITLPIKQEQVPSGPGGPRFQRPMPPQGGLSGEAEAPVDRRLNKPVLSGALPTGNDPPVHEVAPNSLSTQAGPGNNMKNPIQYLNQMNSSPMIPTPMQGMAVRPQTSPSVSAATDTGKRKNLRRHQGRRLLLKKGNEPRTPTSGQYSEFSGVSVPGMPNTSPANAAGVGRSIPPDARIQDSTATNATGATEDASGGEAKKKRLISIAIVAFCCANKR